jgi:hypothetical protein
MEKIPDTFIEFVKQRLPDAEKKSDWQIRTVKEEWKLFGDGGFYPRYLEQKQWIDDGKPQKSFKPNYFDWEDKNTHILFRLLDDWEKLSKERTRINRQKKAFLKLKDTEGTSILELKVKALEYGIKDSPNRHYLQNVNTHYFLKKTPRDLAKELLEIYQKQYDDLDDKITTKLEKVIKLYNDTFKRYASIHT